MADQKQKIYPKGIRVFPPRAGAPDFVKGKIVIVPNDLVAWLKENPGYLNETEKYGKQLSLDLLDGRDGLYVVVNDYKPASNSASDATDDLPF